MKHVNRFIQREISWNAFNSRVLNEGLREDIGLLDRLKFMAITSSNYDEFFMVRVGRLMRNMRAGDHPILPTKERPSKILRQLLSDVHAVIEKQNQTINKLIFPALSEKKLRILPPESWKTEETLVTESIFNNELFSCCTPLVPSDNHNFDQIAGVGFINAAFLLNNNSHAIIRMPDNLKRFIEIQTKDGGKGIILLEDILLSMGNRFFPGRTVEESCLFRVIRDADMAVEEDLEEDFIENMKEMLQSRKDSFPVRLDTKGNAELADWIRTRLNLSEPHHFRYQIPLNLKAFLTIADSPEFDYLREPPSPPRQPKDLGKSDDLWETLKSQDVLLHHPYETFSPVVKMAEAAAEDPKTLAIKMTLYRISGKSPFVEALIKAAKRGVQVTVLVELKARFDENSNIGWANRLEKAGVIVIRGLAVLKVHAKMLLVVRKEDSGIHRYLHLSTGNYNETTARLYTDIGLMTSREEYTRDAALVFNAITGYSTEPHLNILHMAPFTLSREILTLIERETGRAGKGEDAWILAKMNALTDPKIIESLYRASQAGVRINLNVRGICALRPGVPKLSENIRVRSVIDGFLEHTRAFVFRNGGLTDVFISSADWMSRNLERRVELLIPIPDSEHKNRIISILEHYFKDNTHSWELKQDTWERIKTSPADEPFRAQRYFLDLAANRALDREIAEKKALTVRRKSPG